MLAKLIKTFQIYIDNIAKIWLFMRFYVTLHPASMEQTEYFDIIRKAANEAAEGDIRQCYRLMNIALRRSIEQKLADSRLRFGGLFAKTDYLCKEHDADKSLMTALNDLRKRLRGIDSAKTEALRGCMAEDMEALAKFISLIFTPKGEDAGSAIPEDIRMLFAGKKRTRRHRRLIGDCIRMVVQEWDDGSIYGDTEELGYARAMIPSGWEYIAQLLEKGCEVNLVKPRRNDGDEGDGNGGALVPELIIYQPDYLIDITSVAGCFESYANTPYAALLSQLRTVYPTKAIHLGNLASQMLDEEVHGARRSYAESVTDFFRHNALAMAAASDIDASFHSEARQQRENIHNVVSEALGKEVGHYDPAQVILEPSFFCETLGLQGRIDFLQKDFRVLIEQKSGKGGFPQQDPDTPVYQEKHYVQMLLYMAMLHYGYKLDGHDIDNSHIQSFLLYSKYKNGLLRLGAAPELLKEAIMLRNQTAWCEMSYAKGGAEVLLRMTPEKLLRKPISDRFWSMYVRPQLAEILSPIHDATPLEKAYFMRMVQFVEAEHVMAKMGSNGKENSGFSAKWHDTLADKLLAGSILHDLTIARLRHEGDDDGVTGIVMTAQTTDSAISANFRQGDIVALHAYEAGHEPDIRKTIVHRGSIERLSIGKECVEVCVRLKAPQTDKDVFKQRKGWKWALEHDMYESSHTAQLRSLHQFLTAPVHRRAMILGQREPEVNADMKLCGEYGGFNDLVLHAKQAQDMFLVIGPPGTGKTSFGLMNILKEERLSNPEGSVLLMAYTNRAVDEICSKLCHPDDGSEPYDFVRVGSALSCEECYRGYLLEEKSRACRNIGEIRSLTDSSHIFVGTTTSLSAAASSLFRLKSFSLAIIDEASQILEPQLLGLLSATDGIDVAIRKFVMIGDHKQLPAVVQQSEDESRVDDDMLHGIGLYNCRNSLFERMLSLYPAHSYLLRNQGRMHPAIAQFPNEAFYDNKLGIAGLPHQLQTGGQGPRVEFVAVPKPLRSVSDKVNEDEAAAIAQAVARAWQEAGSEFDAQKTVGVIVPYRNQITAVRKALDAYGISELRDVTIDTVERYQGSQRDVIVYGFTVQYVYQLRFLTSNSFLDPRSNAMIDRRLNVALTRARCREVIVGNPDILRHNEVFRRLLEGLKA